jgi:hypothetical protein
VSRRTLFRVLKEVNLSAGSKYAEISDQNLDGYVDSLLKKNPQFGEFLSQPFHDATNVKCLISFRLPNVSWGCYCRQCCFEAKTTKSQLPPSKEARQFCTNAKNPSQSIRSSVGGHSGHNPSGHNHSGQ